MSYYVAVCLISMPYMSPFPPVHQEPPSENGPGDQSAECGQVLQRVPAGMPYMHALYACLICMPYMYALYVRLICTPHTLTLRRRWKRSRTRRANSRRHLMWSGSSAVRSKKRIPRRCRVCTAVFTTVFTTVFRANRV